MPCGRRRDKYKKTPLKCKVLFLKRVLEDGQSIKKVAAEYKINYSTAKTLIRNEKLNKGKVSLADLEISISQTGKDEGIARTSLSQTICEYRPIAVETNFENEDKKTRKIPQIQIISKIEFR